MTQAGSILGTPAYMPPEQARGEIDHLDERSDVFGLGAILCEMLTGAPPYVAREWSDLLQRAQQGNLAEARQRLAACGADAELVSIAERCLAVEPDSRLPTARAVAEAVSGYLTEVQERLRQAELLRAQAEVRAGVERSRRKMQLAVAASVLLVLTVSGSVVWWMREQSIRQQERAELTVNSVLPQVGELERRALWKQAAVLLDQAQNQIGAAADPALLGRLSAARADLRLLTKLDRIRQEKGMSAGPEKLLGAGANSRYVEAFLEFGFDILKGDINDVSQRLRASPVSAALIADLDEWALDEDVANRARLDQITSQATGDAWRREIAELATNADAVERKTREAIQNGAPPAMFRRLARLLQETNQDCVALFEAASRRHPTDFWLHFQRARYYFTSRREPNRAIGAYQAALAVHPDSLPVWYNLGQIYRHQRDLEAAAVCFRRMTECDPQDAGAHFQLGLALRAVGDADGAVESFKKSLELWPEFIEVLNARRPKDWPRHTLAQDPGYAQAHDQLGWLLRLAGHLDEAEIVCRKATFLDPEIAEFHNSLAVVLRDQKRFEDAEAEFRRAIAAAPKSIPFRQNLVNLLSQQRKSVEAIAEQKAIVEIDPSRVSSLFALGGMLKAAQDWDGAISAYNRILEQDLKLIDAHVQHGFCLFKKGSIEEAIESYELALELDPNFASAHNFLGWALLEKQDWQGTIEHCQKAFELDQQLTFAKFNQRTAERELDAQLLAVLAGDREPASPAQAVTVAEMCRAKHRQYYGRSAQFYKLALTAEPSLGNAQHYNAACSAALAASGQGRDQPPLDAIRRTDLRKQALQWLEAELDSARNTLNENPSARIPISLKFWQLDPDLASVREQETLRGLTVEEQAAWQRLWTQVAELIRLQEHSPTKMP